MNLLLCLVILYQLHCILASVISLNGNDWFIISNGSSPDKYLKAEVPGTIYTDLMRNGILNDPYYGWNPMDYQWVGNQTWTYYKSFNITQDTLQNRVIQFVSDGIDTFAEVYINGILIYTSDNMYQQNWINIKPILKQYNNNVTINFLSKVKLAMQLFESCNVSTDVQCPPHLSRKSVEYGFDNFNYLRTEPVSFGWDWAPACMLYITSFYSLNIVFY